LLRRRARADLVVWTGPADLIGRGGIEAPRPDSPGGPLDGLARPREVRLDRAVPADHAGLEERQFDPRGQPPGHLAPGQRVDLELKALARPLVGLLLVGDVAGLVVDDDDAVGGLVHPVQATAHARRTEVEPELLLDGGRLLTRCLFLSIEAREGPRAGLS